MREVLFIIGIIIAMGVGVILHERDMYNNLIRDGDAHAWTCEIVSLEMKGIKRSN